MIGLSPRSTLFPYTSHFQSLQGEDHVVVVQIGEGRVRGVVGVGVLQDPGGLRARPGLLEDEPCGHAFPLEQARPRPEATWVDRKRPRLNSSHGYISYAAFCF